MYSLLCLACTCSYGLYVRYGDNMLRILQNVMCTLYVWCVLACLYRKYGKHGECCVYCVYCKVCAVCMICIVWVIFWISWLIEIIGTLAVSSFRLKLLDCWFMGDSIQVRVWWGVVSWSGSTLESFSFAFAIATRWRHLPSLSVSKSQFCEAMELGRLAKLPNPLKRWSLSLDGS